MAKEILDIYVEKGYEYEFNLNFNSDTGTDLEPEYECWFESPSIGTKQYTVSEYMFKLTLSASDTNKLTTNLEKYAVYVNNISSGIHSKLLTGRIHVEGL